MTRVLPSVLALVLTACAAGTVKLDDDTGGVDGGSTDGGTADGGIESDGGSSDGGSSDGGSSDGGSSDGGSSDGGSEEPTTVDFSYDTEASGGALVLVQVTELGGEDIGLGETLDAVETPSGTHFSMELGPAPEDHLFEIDAKAFPGFRLAMYAPVPTGDEDGDLSYDEGETVFGATMHWPTWMEAPVPEELEGMGFQPGWNVLVLNFEDELPEAGDIGEVPVGLIPDHSTLTVSGTWSVESFPAAYAGVVVLPGTIFDGTDPTSVMDEAPADPPWELTLDGAPPDDHWTDIDGDGVEEALEVFGAFPDLDDDGEWDGGAEVVSLLACHDGDLVLAAWNPMPTSVLDALFFTQLGYPAGWMLLADPDGASRILEPGEESELDFDEGCAG